VDPLVSSVLFALLSLAPLQKSQEPAAPPAPPPKSFAAVDRFGTSRFTAEKLLEPLRPRFAEYEQASLAHDYEKAAPIQHELETAVKQAGGFAFVKFSVVRYFREGDPSYLTIDVVEPADVARRMTFAKPPADAAALPDPEGLLAKYGEYEKKGFELLAKHEKIKNAASSRELLHCPFGFAHAELAPFKPILVDGARRHVDDLVAIVHRDTEAQHRAFAIFLLAFTVDGARVVREIVPACKDESSLVRNNALRVFAETAHHHPEVALPLAPVLDALEFPETTDRNKASAILEPLSKKKELQTEIRRRAGTTIVAMLKLKQPNNHDFAVMILKNLHGEQTPPIGDEDVAGWEAWLARGD